MKILQITTLTEISEKHAIYYPVTDMNLLLPPVKKSTSSWLHIQIYFEQYSKCLNVASAIYTYAAVFNFIN